MRKMTKLLTAALGAVLAFSCFASCGSSIQPTAANGGSSPAPETTSNPVVLLNGYENERDLNSVMVYEYFGTVDVEKAPTDKTAKSYVKSGAGSAKLMVEKDKFGGARKTYNPYIYQATYIQSRGIDCRDFGKTVAIEADIYNAQDKAMQVGIRLVYSSTYHDNNVKEAVEWYTLAPNAWTTIHYNVVREKIPQNKLGSAEDAGTCPKTAFSLVRGFDFLFKRPTAEEENAIFYLDDTRIFRTTQGVESVAKVETGADVFADFEAQWQINALRMNVPNETYRASLTWSRAYASDGGHSLRVDMKDGSKGYTYLQLQRSSLFSHLNLGDYSGEDKFVFDVYSPTDSGYTGGVTIWLINNANYFYAKRYNIAPGKMITISMTVDEINASEYVDYMSFQYFEYMTTIQVSWTEPGTNCTLYLDNFRMEKAKA